MLYITSKRPTGTNSAHPMVADHTTNESDHERAMRRGQACADSWGLIVRVEWGSGPRARRDFLPGS